MNFALAVVASLLLGAPAAAQEPPTNPQDEIVCKSKRVKSLGSNLAAKPVCRTRAEWAEISASTRRELQTASDRAINPTPIPGAR